MFRIGLDHYFFGVCLILAFKFSLGNPKVCLKSHNASFRFLQSFLQVTLKLLTGCHWSWCHWKCFFLHGGLADAIEVAYCFQRTTFDSNTHGFLFHSNFCWKFTFYQILSISGVSFHWYYKRRYWHLPWRWQCSGIIIVQFWTLAKIQLFLSLNLKSLALYSFGRLVVPFFRLIQGGVHGGVCKSLLKLYIIKNPISRSNSSTCFLSIYTGIQVFISLDEAVSSDVCSISWS